MQFSSSVLYDFPNFYLGTIFQIFLSLDLRYFFKVNMTFYMIIIERIQNNYVPYLELQYFLSVLALIYVINV